MKNVVLTIFNDEGKTYQALSELKTRNDLGDVYTAGVIKNNQGHIEVKDGFNFSDDNDNWATGGLIGSLIGMLGGPVGVLLGSGLGMTIGTGFDLDELDDTQSVLQNVVTDLAPSNLALIAIVDEVNPLLLDQFFAGLKATSVIRKSFVDAQAEVYQQEELEKKLAKEAKTQMKQEKKEKWQAMAEAKEEEFKSHFKHFKHKEA